MFLLFSYTFSPKSLSKTLPKRNPKPSKVDAGWNCGILEELYWSYSVLDFEPWALCLVNGSVIGELRSACYSPYFKKAIGIAMINEPFCKVSENGKLEIDGKTVALKVCDLPFI